MSLNIKEPFPHNMMPRATHDEHARENITVSIKHFMSENIYPNDEQVYENLAKPKFVKENGRPPENSEEVHRLMMREPFTQTWSAIARTLQEMLWDNQGEITWRQLPRLKDQAKFNATMAKGSISLDPEFEVPRYIDAVDIHVMPGGYQTSQTDDDLYTPAVYDRGAYYYTRGMVGRKCDGGGNALINCVKHFYPKIKPKRILDLGCAVGWTTTPLVDEWPDAVVHGVDVGAAFIRYAGARAEALGKTVHFHQMSGEHLDFPDGYFDLVISGGVYHETSKKAAVCIIKEIHRVLRRGGVNMNYDIPFGGDYNLHEQFMLNWDCYYNSEPFWRQWTSWDRTDFLSWGGFKKDKIIDAWADRDHEGNFKFFDKPFDDLHTSAQGGIGRVQFFGAQK